MSYFELQSSNTCWKADHDGSDITVIRFSPNSRQLAVGTFNGNVYVRDAITSRLMYKIDVLHTSNPITSIKWHPKIDNAFLCSSASGYVSLWHTETGQNLWMFKEEGNETSSIAISPSGTQFTTVGSDKVVRIYAIQKHVKLYDLSARNYDQGVVTGHQSRIYAASYLNDDVVATAGWDDTVLFWDIRTGKVERSIFGPHLNGEPMAFVGNKLITGSNRAENQLQMFDIGTGKCEKTISIGRAGDSLLIYSLSITTDSKFIGVCGGGLKKLQFYRSSDLDLAAQTEQFDTPLNTVHFSESNFGVGLGNSKVLVDKYAID